MEHQRGMKYFIGILNVKELKEVSEFKCSSSTALMKSGMKVEMRHGLDEKAKDLVICEEAEAFPLPKDLK